MFNIKQNNLIKGLSKKAIGGLVFGIMAVIGVAVVVAFTEPISGPTGFDEPTNTEDKGDWVAYGRGWSPNSSGIHGITVLTKGECDDAAGWNWFEDGNGDTDETDEEDGICVKTATIASSNWGGTETNDNTYIAAYTCSGNFPTGIVATGPAGCALCIADCYDGKKDLPDQGGYTAPDASCDGALENCYEGPITPEVLKNWKGTRLPTHNDFFGFCGDGTDTKATGEYGVQVGREGEYIDTADDHVWEWLSEQHYYHSARIAGYHACSHFNHDNVSGDSHFRAVFRP